MTLQEAACEHVALSCNAVVFTGVFFMQSREVSQGQNRDQGVDAPAFPVTKLTTVTREDLPPALVESLSERGVTALLSHLNDEKMTGIQQQGLLTRLGQIRWEEMRRTYQAPSLDQVSAPEVTPLSARASLRAQVEEAGRQAYAAGEVGVLLVAGGDGTRLGFDRPKGCFPIGPVSEVTLYQKLAEKVLAQSRRSDTEVPFVIMTGPNTDAPTREFFVENNYFGLAPQQVRFFQQATIPTTTVPDQAGRFELLFKGPGELLESPNGHGGTIDGLIDSGSLDWLLERGIKDIVYLQVDNALAPVFDPFGVGLRRAGGVDMVTKVIPKVAPDEKMGALVSISGVPAVVEYSDLNREQQVMTNPDGSLLFGWGNVAAHIFSTGFFDAMRSADVTLPYHQAHKKVSAWTGEIDSSSGQPVMAEIQGRKSERFIFDVLGMGSNAGLEISRAEEFAPLKNREGSDSIATARELISKEHARWLAEAGMPIEAGSLVEISPLFADSAEALQQIDVEDIRFGKDVLFG